MGLGFQGFQFSGSDTISVFKIMLKTFLLDEAYRYSIISDIFMFSLYVHISIIVFPPLISDPQPAD